MVSSGKNAVYEPSRAELERSLVVNNGVTSPKWSIESTGDSLYFKGERQTSFGVNKFIILCEKRHLSLYAIFDPQGRETEVMNFGANSLVIDGQRSPISPLSERIQNHWFNGFYNLTPAQWNSISNAKTVGITRQMTYESPIFLGFDSMPISDGKPKLIGFMRGCR